MVGLFMEVLLLQMPQVVFQPLPAIDDCLVTQPFTGSYSAGIACESSSGIMLAEDCYPSTDYSVGDVFLWLGFQLPISVTNYNIGFQIDNSGSPAGTFIWYGNESNVEYQDVGLYMWGLHFQQVHITIAVPPVLEGGGAYWFCFQPVSPPTVGCLATGNIPAWNEMFYISIDNGDTWESSLNTFGDDYAYFLILSGSTSLERTSWGRIKTLLQPPLP